MSRWIPTLERMPKNADVVDVWARPDTSPNQGMRIADAEWNGSCWSLRVDGFVLLGWIVTHWRRAPGAPRPRRASARAHSADKARLTLFGEPE